MSVQIIRNILTIGLGSILLMLLSFILHFSIDLPDYNKLNDYDLSLTTKIYSHDHQLLSEYYNERRTYVPIRNVPQQVINAFIAAEDKSFYSNIGINPIKILFSIPTNIYNLATGKRVIGASTITQQLIKNTLLTPDRTIKRKIQEIILALEVSSNIPKDKIMELYLNLIYFGSGAYGILAAAETYFDKSLSQLDLAEAALLAALPKAPSKLNPFIGNTTILERRNWVLERMKEDGYISSQEVSEAKAQPIKLSHQGRDNHAKFFLDEIQKQLIQRYGKEEVYTKGLTIISTLNDHYQKLAEQALMNGLQEYNNSKKWEGSIKNWQERLSKMSYNDELQPAIVLANSDRHKVIGLPSGKIAISKLNNEVKMGDIISVANTNGEYNIVDSQKVNGAIVVIEVKTGRVLAMVGGRDYDQSQFNIATQAKRQLGSVFKPFVYLAALENNFMPHTIVNDEKIEIKQGARLPYWQPRNYENIFFGPNSLREGLEFSHNITTVHIARAIGMGKIIDTMKCFNLYNHTDIHSYATVLGASSAPLLNIVNAYAVLANNGVKIKPYFIDKIFDKGGNQMFQHNRNKQIITNEVVAYQITSMLQGAVEHGTAKRVKPLGITIAAKTGTSNDSKDAWFIGFTPEIAVGVYVGFDKPKALGGRYATGARIALPIFYEFMKSLNLPDKPFPVPKTVKFVATSPGKWEVLKRTS